MKIPSSKNLPQLSSLQKSKHKPIMLKLEMKQLLKGEEILTSITQRKFETKELSQAACAGLNTALQQHLPLHPS